MTAVRVLVVDDSGVTRALLARTLTQAGFEVLEAADGAEGAVLALRERPSVVVTDIEMPTMDGYQLLRLLKHDPASRGIPVLILTTHSEAASRFWGHHAGADAYLIKDHEPEQLVESVRALAAAAPPPRQARAGADAEPESPLRVLARVARQLDASLMQATITNTLLERGVLAEDFGEAGRVAMTTIAEVVDADALAVAFAEEDAITLHVLLLEPLTEEDVEAFSAEILQDLVTSPHATVDITLHGEDLGSGRPSSAPRILPLHLREATGALALLPRDASQYELTSRHLVEGLTGHLALVLDNARLGQRLRELSMLDGLTRAMSRRAIYDRLDEELERARRYDHPLAVAICDLDHFKTVNDTFGHLAGDAALRAAAQAMRRCLRTADAFGRYGGEEFLAVLPETGLEAGVRVAERLRAALDEAAIVLAGGETLRVTASFGVASRSELAGAATPDALVSLADARLYEAKAGGRNTVRP